MNQEVYDSCTCHVDTKSNHHDLSQGSGFEEAEDIEDFDFDVPDEILDLSEEELKRIENEELGLPVDADAKVSKYYEPLFSPD